ncbi:MAG TPA: RraA family protein [Chloroflexota bacterium]|nr:RraA family protein [Chloroflexota bacterium]
MAKVDTYELVREYKRLRVTDVLDALDQLTANADQFIMDEAMRPVLPGIHFCGPAVTRRYVKAQPVPLVPESPEAYREYLAEWVRTRKGRAMGEFRPGSVLVFDCHQTPRVGLWGSANGMGAVAKGAAGIVTDGGCRDRYEVALERLPIFATHFGAYRAPNRMELGDADAPIHCAGVVVVPGDLIVADDDGVAVIPQDLAADVPKLAREVLAKDMAGRRRLYQTLGLPLDETVEPD